MGASSEHHSEQTVARLLCDVLDAIGFGALFLGSQAEVRLRNAKAKRLADGEVISVVKHRLAFRQRDASEALRRMLKEAEQFEEWDRPLSDGMMTLARPERRPLIVRALPIGSALRDHALGATALLVLFDPEEHVLPAPACLQRIFGLSRAEAATAIQLACGGTVREIAATRNVSTGTTRMQLKAVFEKTQARRQSELVWLLARLALLAPSDAAVRFPVERNASVSFN